MAFGLFISLLIALLLIFVPKDKYDVSPSNLAIDAIKRGLGHKMASGEKKAMLETIGKTPADMLKTGVLLGTFLGVVLFLIGFKIIGPLAAVLGVVGFVAGIVLAENILQNEHKKWQMKLFEGISPLTDFVPAFLDVGNVTPRQSLLYTIPFLPEPLRGELWNAIDRIVRTGRVREAMDALAQKAKHPTMDAICFRLSASWDAKVTSDIFTDLSDQVDEMREMAAAQATVKKTAMITMVCVLGVIGLGLEFLYPAGVFLFDKLIGSFGI